MKFVCAFRGRRDGYEVPLALAESGRLERFITDFYLKGPASFAASLLPGRMREKVEARTKPGVPHDRVECLWGRTLWESLLIRAGRPAAATYMRHDAAYSRAAAEVARRTGSHLFLYSPYAMPAFRESFEHKPLKVLFQYHPHAIVERSILLNDSREWSEHGLEFSNRLSSTEAPAGEPDYDRGWDYADHIVCASTFTKRSLVEIGADAARISVVPYGVDAAMTHSDAPPCRSPEFRALFVGSGMQRKGLHHLLAAWNLAALGATARLTVVSRVIEPALASMISKTPGATLRSHVTQAQLAQLYIESSLFCMPSIVEGFGQVYLEALSHGLPVLGTPNTCLPDLGGEGDGVFITEPGNVDELATMLRRLAERIPGDAAIRNAARRCSQRFTWPAFRRRITDILESLEGPAG